MPNLLFSGGFDGRVLGFLGHQREQEKRKELEEMLGTKTFLRAHHSSGTILYPGDSEMNY